MSTVELPNELVVEILSWMPVKSLLRFRCVSKTWRSLIESSSFVRLHLSKNRNSKIHLFQFDDHPEVNLSFAEVYLLKRSDRLHFQSLTLPMFSPLDVEVVGLCDGLICLSTSLFTKFVLVNPSTREYKLLPPISKELLFGAVGLGYDCSADEYKVVVIPEDESVVHIYGSTSNTWRQMDVSCLYHGREYQGDGHYTHGALHWIVGCHSQTFHIMVFDLVNEKFTMVEYDKHLFGNPEWVFLWVVGGRLCLYCEHKVEEGKEGYFDIWVMEEYGAKESWSKLVSFDRSISLLAFSTGRRHLLFRVFRRWLRSCSLHWYDLDKKSFEHVDTWMASDYHVCLQSLIQLESKLP